MGILQHERGPVWTFTFQRKIRRSFNELVRLAREHPASAGALGDPLVRQKLAQSYIEVELLKLMGYRSLTTCCAPAIPAPESSLEKVIGSETDQRLQELAVSLFGPYGGLQHGEHALDAARCRDIHLRALGDDHGRHLGDPAQRHRAAHPRPAALTRVTGRARRPEERGVAPAASPGTSRTTRPPSGRVR